MEKSRADCYPLPLGSQPGVARSNALVRRSSGRYVLIVSVVLAVVKYAGQVNIGVMRVDPARLFGFVEH